MSALVSVNRWREIAGDGFAVLSAAIHSEHWPARSFYTLI